jgi:hypothetical protein
VASVKANWLKGRSFWQVSIPQNASWSWKKLLKLRSIAKPFIKHLVGDGSSIFLWFDNWHPVGCLFYVYGFRVMYDAGHSIGPMLSSIVKDGYWHWPNARSDALVDIQCTLPEVVLGDADKVIWDSKSDAFSSSETWEKLREVQPSVDWHKVVWFPVAIPKHSFMSWLAFHGALITKEKMCGWGFSGDCLCLFCHACLEIQVHLFFSCGFSSRIWKTIMADCSIPCPPLEWDMVKSWSVQVMKGNNFSACVTHLC